MFCYVKSAHGQPLQYKGSIPAILEGQLYYKLPQKKIQDSFVDQRGDFILIFEGIVANASEIINRYGVKCLQDVIWKACETPHIIAELHGQFRIFILNTVCGDFKAFNNPTNNCRVYYWHENGALVVADSIHTVMQVLLGSGITPKVSLLGARMLLSYGYMLEEYSTIENIRSLPSAGGLRFLDDKLSVGRYHEWSSEILYSDPRQCASEIDRLFTKAVTQAFSRDEEGKHLAFLSGGLDSRMTVYCAHAAGFRNFQTLVFSEPGYLDVTIARSIAAELGLESNFYSLEKGNYLSNLAENLVYNDGQIILHGAAHLFRAIRDYEPGDYAILHSGQIGAIMQGNFLQSGQHSNPDISAAAYSDKILGSFIHEMKGLETKYRNQELLLLHNRGFNGAINGDLACYPSTHSLSPFLAPEFLQYTLNIDPKIRIGTKLFFQWINSCHPRAGRHVWEKTNARPTAPRWLVKSKYYLWRGSNKIKRKLTGEQNRLSMNPFDYWWAKNPVLRGIIRKDMSCIEEILPSLDPELAKDLLCMSLSPSFSERLQAYSLARGLQYLYGSMDEIDLQRCPRAGTNNTMIPRESI